MKNKIIGKLGEDIACKYLEENGYIIFDRNYTFNHYEADIIAYKDDMLIIVEVKTRKDYKYTYAHESVNTKKKSNIISLTKHYMMINHLSDYNIRFDIIEVYWYIKQINHIENAFEAYHV